MTTRTNSEMVTFPHPFTLSGVDGVQPAGQYRIETEEVLIESLSFVAYRRVSTIIRLPGRPGSGDLEQVVDVVPEELTAILERESRAER
jgi:hypothetical protein